MVRPASGPRWHSPWAVPNEYAASKDAIDGFHFERVVTPISETWLPLQVQVGDVTGDGLPDIVMVMGGTTPYPMGWNLLRITPQLADGSLGDPVDLDVPEALNAGGSLTLVDLDGKGSREIAVGNEDGLTIYRHSGEGFTWKFYPGYFPAMFLAGIDVDGDGWQDVFAQGWSDGADLYFGDGTGGIQRVEHIQTPAMGYNILEVFDFTADGIDDLLMSNSAGWSRVWLYPFRPDAGLDAPIEFDLSPYQMHPPLGMTAADMDLDGNPDIVVTQGSDSEPRGVRVLYGNGKGAFIRETFLPTTGYYVRPGAIAVADVDRNGFPDVVAMINSNDQMAYILQGPDGFADPILQLTDDNPWTSNHYGDNSFVIADVNSDRCKDIVLAEMSSSLRIFYGRNCHAPAVRTGGPAQVLPVD